MARFELTLLGTCAFRLDGKPIHGFASDKARLLLAYLAVEGGRPQPRARLVEIFWSQHPPQSRPRQPAQRPFQLARPAPIQSLPYGFSRS
jgi:hypothetical protein